MNISNCFKIADLLASGDILQSMYVKDFKITIVSKIDCFIEDLEVIEYFF